jgi:hypothetical protein
MEKMQEFIEFIFSEVWCKAPNGKPFSLELFEANAELREVMQSFYFDDLYYNDNKEELKKKDKPQPTTSKFYASTLEIYCLFSKLNHSQIDQIQQFYRANNDIEKVCANDPSVHVARYADLEATYPDLSKQLATFFKGLYSQDLLNLAALKKKIGQIDNHYHEFMAVNKKEKCPFCGIIDMLGVYHTRREAYDHYLPKSIYPFNSINFRNLVPACHYCNSSYKLSRDPAFTPKDPAGKTSRRKVFYPYAVPSHKIEITIDLNTSDVEHLSPSDVQLTFGPNAINEELETWKDVYGIEERYKAKCCGCDAKDWLEQVRINAEHGIEPEITLTTLRQQSKIDPIANSNFLKIAFLEGCHRLGLWT